MPGEEGDKSEERRGFRDEGFRTSVQRENIPDLQGFINDIHGRACVRDAERKKNDEKDCQAQVTMAYTL